MKTRMETLQARILSRITDLFGLMFKKVRNGKIPSAKLETCLENLHNEKPIMMAKHLPVTWPSDTGGFLF